VIHKQVNVPMNAQVGDAWVSPDESFKRVLSRGGAWENVNLGETHKDEVDHEQQQRAQAEQRDDSAEVSSGTSAPAPGDGNDGQVSGVSTGGEEDSGVIRTPEAPENHIDNAPKEEGIDSDRPPVV